MTREEAIKILVNATFSDEYQGNNDLTMAYQMAIEALEQEPKTGHWVRWYVNNVPHCKCSECSMEYNPNSSQFIAYCYKCGAKMEEKNEKIQVMALDDIGKNAIHGLINGMDAEPEFAEVTGTNDVEVGDILYCKETRCYYMVTAKDRSSITILNYAGNTYVHSIYDPHRTYFKTTLHVGSFEHILNELERLSNE